MKKIMRNKIGLVSIFVLSMFLTCFNLKCLTWASSDVVSFEDPVVEKVVRTTLSKATGDITQGDLEGLTSLNFNSEYLEGRVTSFKGLEFANNLRGIYFDYHDFSSKDELTKLFSPLFESDSLTTLYFSNAPISDISVFSKLKSLTRLGISEGPVVSLEDYVTHLGHIDHVSYDTDVRGLYVSSNQLQLENPISYNGVYFEPSSYPSNMLSLSSDFQTISVITPESNWNTPISFSYSITGSELGLPDTHSIRLNYKMFISNENEETASISNPELLSALRNVLGSDVKLTTQLTSTITNLDLSGQQLTDLTGISNFTNLDVLNLSHNELKEFPSEIQSILRDWDFNFNASYNKITNIATLPYDSIEWAEGAYYRFDNQSPEFEAEIVDDQLIVSLEGHPDSYYDLRYFNFSHGQFNLDTKTLTFSSEELAQLQKTKSPITFSFSQILGEDFYTGRIMYDGVATIHITSINGVPVGDASQPVANEANLTVTGDVQPMIVSVDVPTHLNFSIDPNSKTQMFVSPEFNVVNESSAPLRLSLLSFEQENSLLVDVLPTKYTDAEWNNLDSSKSNQIAIGVQSVSRVGDWLNLVDGGLLYAKEIQDGTKSWLGDLNPNSTVTLQFTAKHGLAFQTALNPVYKITFLFDLLG